jgi:hypothetical protein
VIPSPDLCAPTLIALRAVRKCQLGMPSIAEADAF